MGARREPPQCQSHISFEMYARASVRMPLPSLSAASAFIVPPMNSTHVQVHALELCANRPDAMQTQPLSKTVSSWRSPPGTSNV